MCKHVSIGIFKCEHLPSLEPQQTEHTSNTHILLKHFSDGNTSIQQLLASLITDRCHETGRFTDQSQLLKGDKIKNWLTGSSQTGRKIESANIELDNGSHVTLLKDSTYKYLGNEEKHKGMPKNI